MCGFVGVVSEFGTPISVGASQLQHMRDKMYHRGPDGCGSFQKHNVAFQHRRLAIRDRSAGQQPWVNQTESLVLVYNGELYNDAELRGELRQSGHTFKTSSDTETLFAAWQHWSTDSIHRLQGMFAFAAFDFDRQELFLVRDRFGIKPLYYAAIGQEFVFASSIAAILAHPRIDRRPDWTTVNHYLATTRPTMGRRTLFDDVFQLRPAEMLRWNARNGELQIQQYWTFPTERNLDVTFDEASHEFESKLIQATRSHLVSDVPTGVFLSGGVDSSMLASVVSDVGGSAAIAGCAIGESDHVDSDVAKVVAKTHGMECHTVDINAGDYFDTWNQIVEKTCQPLTTPSDVLIYKLAQCMKQHVGVVLGGEGADELLCGYALPHWSVEDYRLTRVAEQGKWAGSLATRNDFLRSIHLRYGRVQFSDAADHYLAANSLIPQVARESLLSDGVDFRQCEESLREFYQQQYLAAGVSEQDTAGDFVHEHAIVLHRLNLESLLARLDTTTMLASLEARVPYADHTLVEFAYQLPTNYRIDVNPAERCPVSTAVDLESRGSLRAKRLLRHIARRRLPRSLADRQKRSFSTRVPEWISGAWHSEVQRRLRTSPFGQQFFRPAAIEALASNVATAGMWIWPLLNILNWGDSQFI